MKGESSLDIAGEISNFSRDNGMKVAFTSFTAGAIYTNYSVRYDSVYLYLQREDFKKFSNTFATNESSGIKIHLYRPIGVFGTIPGCCKGFPLYPPHRRCSIWLDSGIAGETLP